MTIDIWHIKYQKNKVVIGYITAEYITDWLHSEMTIYELHVETRLSVCENFFHHEHVIV